MTGLSAAVVAWWWHCWRPFTTCDPLIKVFLLKMTDVIIGRGHIYLNFVYQDPKYQDYLEIWKYIYIYFLNPVIRNIYLQHNPLLFQNHATAVSEKRNACGCNRGHESQRTYCISRSKKGPRRQAHDWRKAKIMHFVWSKTFEPWHEKYCVWQTDRHYMCTILMKLWNKRKNVVFMSI